MHKNTLLEYTVISICCLSGSHGYHMCLNPLTLKMSWVILLTVCHTIYVMLVWRIWNSYLSALYLTNNVRRNSVLVTSGTKSFNSQDLTSNFPYCLLNSSCDVSLEDLVLDHLIIHQLIFFFILITCLLDIVLIL